MISYNNGEVVQSLRQYEMFANSLKLISSNEERKMVINQLNKLLAKIIKESNAVYEEEYNKLYEREIEFIDEERTRLTLLVELINQRISYVDKLCQKHYQLTYENIDLPPIRGKDELEELQNRIKIIDKYSKNIKTCHELELEIENMESKLSLAKEKINVNDSLNQELEHKLIELLHNTFSELSLDLLIDEQSNIEDNFYECENLYSIAKKNLEKSRIKNPEMINECQEMLNEIEEDYKEYNNKMCILGLIEIYDRKVDTYDELLTKRNKIKELMNGVTNKEFLNRVETEINKQYSSIIKEEQDINTYNEIVGEFLVSAKEKQAKLQKYKDEKDMANYTIYVHSLKSDAKYFGFTKLATMAEEQEQKSKEGDVFFIYENFQALIDEIQRMMLVVKKYLYPETQTPQTSQTATQVVSMPDPQTVASAPVENLPEPYTQKTILVADDSNIIRNFVKRIFSEKYNVGVAQDGEEALKIIKANQNNEEIVAVLLDLNMPRVDGFAVLDFMNNNQLFSKMPVSIISGDSSKDTIAKAFGYQIVDMLAKPFTEMDIKHVVEKTIYFKNID